MSLKEFRDVNKGTETFLRSTLAILAFVCSEIANWTKYMRVGYLPLRWGHIATLTHYSVLAPARMFAPFWIRLTILSALLLWPSAVVPELGKYWNDFIALFYFSGEAAIFSFLMGLLAKMTKSSEIHLRTMPSVQELTSMSLVPLCLVLSQVPQHATVIAAMCTVIYGVYHVYQTVRDSTYNTVNIYARIPETLRFWQGPSWQEIIGLPPEKDPHQ